MEKMIATISFSTKEFNLKMAMTELYANHITRGYLRYDIAISETAAEECCTILYNFNDKNGNVCEYNIKFLRFGLRKVKDLTRRQ